MKTKLFLSKVNKSINSDDYIRYILFKYYDYDFNNIFIKRTDNGKPFLENIPIYYSVSHKKNYIVAILSLENIGIDMEMLDNKNRFKIAKKYFNTFENEYIYNSNNNQEQNQRFIEIWTKKEAYIKKYGLNLSYISKIDSLNKDILTTQIDNLIISIC